MNNAIKWEEEMENEAGRDAFSLHKKWSEKDQRVMQNSIDIRQTANQQVRVSVCRGDKNDALRYVANLDRLGLLKRIERELIGVDSCELPFNLSQLLANAFNDGKEAAKIEIDAKL